jgi:hypothetical protein
MAATAPRINPLNGGNNSATENRDLVFCEHSTSPLVVSKELMLEVCHQVNEGLRALRRGGGVEVGGLLIGAKSGNNRLTVERIVPIVTEHRFGPAFHLSPTDIGGFEQTIASAHHEQGRSVIGFYRSRTRGDAIPRESDQEILNTLARVHPAYEVDFRFFLIFTPLSKVDVEISIAQRRDGGWHDWREIKLRTEPMSFISDVSGGDSSLERAKYPGLALESATARARSATVPRPGRQQTTTLVVRHGRVDNFGGSHGRQLLDHGASVRTGAAPQGDSAHGEHAHRVRSQPGRCDVEAHVES